MNINILTDDERMWHFSELGDGDLFLSDGEPYIRLCASSPFGYLNAVSLYNGMGREFYARDRVKKYKGELSIKMSDFEG